MKRLVRAIFFAAVLTFWPERMWSAEAETPPTVAMFQAMEWCLPMTATPGAPMLDDGDEGLLVTLETRDFMLIWMDPAPELNFRTVRHPVDQRMRIGFGHRYPGPPNEDRLFMQLAAGCFALSYPPEH